MKTTTKIEIGFLIFSCLCGLMFQLFMKSAMVNYKVETVQATGINKVESFDFTNFDNIESSVDVPIEFTYGNFQIDYEHDEAIQDQIEFSVEGQTLRIQYQENSRHSQVTGNYKHAIRVSCPVLKGIMLRHNAEFNSLDTLNNEFNSIELSHNAEATLTVNSNEISTSMNHNTKVNISGKVEKTNLDLSFNSNFEGATLASQSVSAALSHNSQAKIQAFQKVDGNVRFNSTLNIYGKPTQVIVEKAHNSSVEVID